LSGARSPDPLRMLILVTRRGETAEAAAHRQGIDPDAIMPAVVVPEKDRE